MDKLNASCGSSLAAVLMSSIVSCRPGNTRLNAAALVCHLLADGGETV